MTTRRRATTNALVHSNRLLDHPYVTYHQGDQEPFFLPPYPPHAYYEAVPYHTPEFRKGIRDKWISGEYATLSALSRATGVSRTSLNAWRREENWDEERKRVLAASREKTEERLIERLSQVNLRHYTLWSAFDQQVFKRFERAKAKNVDIDLEELDQMARILERSQRGQRIAMGVDKTPEEHAKQVEIIYEGLEHALERDPPPAQDQGEPPPEVLDADDL